MDCLFCKIINNEIPSYTVFEDDIVKVILDINPSTNGDCLIIPKTHYVNILDIDELVLNHINKIAKELYLKLQKKLNCDGLTIVINNNYGQDIKHFHMHLTPRYKNDELIHNFNKDLLKPLIDINNILN